MAKELKSRTEIEAIVLEELRKVKHCRGVKSVQVNSIDDPSVHYTWNVPSFNEGEEAFSEVKAALKPVEERLQQKFDIILD